MGLFPEENRIGSASCAIDRLAQLAQLIPATLIQGAFLVGAHVGGDANKCRNSDGSSRDGFSCWTKDLALAISRRRGLRLSAAPAPRKVGRGNLWRFPELSSANHEIDLQISRLEPIRLFSGVARFKELSRF